MAPYTPQGVGPVVEGLRLGTVVEVSGQVGQLESWSTEEQAWSVCFLNGESCTASPENVKALDSMKRPGSGGDPSGFDLLVGPGVQSFPPVLQEELSACLIERGFCVLRVCERKGLIEKAVGGMQRLGGEGKLQRFPEEVEQGYLGTNFRGKVLWLDKTDRSVSKDALPLLWEADAFFDDIAAMIQPFAPEMFGGKSVDERTPSLVGLTLLDEEDQEYPPQEADDHVLGQFLTTHQRSLLKVVHFMGPNTAQVLLEPTGEAAKLPCPQEAVEIDAATNTILIFRPAVYTYSCNCESEMLFMTTHFLEQVGKVQIDNAGDLDISLLASGSGPAGLPGEGVNVVNMATRLPACWDEAEGYGAGLFSATDGAIQIPLTRWDSDFYYNPDDDSRQPWQTYLKHQSYVEGLELFDNKYFQINNNDAMTMDPLQRHTLIVVAQNLFKMGITKKAADRTPHHGGCSVGLDKDDWDKIIAKECGCEGNLNQQAIISNRVSFIFNMKGPNYVADTACSASLCATHLGIQTLADRVNDKIEFHIGIGIHNVLAPWGFAGPNPAGHMISGRCMTFNETANGYMRGDGCSGLTLKWGNRLTDLKDEHDCMWRGSKIGQNGKSATLTAPNGIAQEDVISKAMKNAQVRGPESCIWNCHGTGTSLGDPIEIGGVRRVQIREDRAGPLIVCTNKTHVGHLEGGAAMTSLIGCALQLKKGAAIPCCHLAVLNPNLENSQFSMFYNTDISSTRLHQNVAHVSSFGFGGTNGHAVFWAAEQLTTASADVEALVMRKLRRMAPPEVRVNGSDPSEWEWDGIDADAKPGDKYRLDIVTDGTQDEAPLKWVKEESAPEPDDGEDDFYSITGPFNDWDQDRLEDTTTLGLRSIELEVPESGELEFRFLKNGEEGEVFHPVHDKCTRRGLPVQGPAESSAFTWLAEGIPGEMMRIELFVCRGRSAVSWMPA